jgi:hypothetical protein
MGRRRLMPWHLITEFLPLVLILIALLLLLLLGFWFFG